jgi:hypothetical protein
MELKLNFFFLSYRMFSSVKKSSEGAQGAEVKPSKNLGCLAPFFPQLDLLSFFFFRK